MEDLRSQLQAWRGHSPWLLGAGNPERGDDAFGVRLVERLREAFDDHDQTASPLRLVDAGTCPERYVGLAAEGGCQELVFADAVDFGGAPGALILAGAEDLRSSRVGTSTHRVPLAVLAQYAEGLGVRAWLLGVQPASLRDGDPLSPVVARALEALVELMVEVLGAGGEAVTSRARARTRSRAGGDAGVDR